MNAPHSGPAPLAPLSLPIEGMTCASCVKRVEKALARVPGVRDVAVNLATERAMVHLEGGQAVDLSALTAAVSQAGYAVPERTTELAVEGMTCASCVGRVERALRKVPGVSEASVNLATERATVRGVAPSEALIAAIAKAGYEARTLAPEGDHAEEIGRAHV